MTDQVRSVSYFLNLLHPNIPNATPDATVLEAQAARDLIVSLTSIVSPGVFVVPTTDYPATFAGINAAIVAANALGGGTVYVAGGLGAITYAGTSIAPLDNVKLLIGNGTWLQTSASGGQYMISRSGSLDGGTTTFNATVAIGARAGTLSAPMPTVAKDDLVAIHRGSAYQIMKVRSISGTAITFYDSFEYAYTTSWTVQKVLLPLQNFTFSGEIRNVSNTTTEVRGIFIQNAENLVLEDVKINGFDQSAITQVGWGVLHGYNTIIRNMVIRDCGTPGASAMQLASCTHSTLNNVVAICDNGQPYVMQNCVDLSLVDCVISGGGRCLEIDTVASLRLDNVEIVCMLLASDNAIALESSNVGIHGIAFHTRDVELNRVDMSGAQTALNIFDQYIENVRLNNCNFYNNTTDISIPATCVNIHVGPECTYTTYSTLTATSYNYRWQNGTTPAVYQTGTLVASPTYNRIFRQRTRVDFEMGIIITNAAGAVAAVIEVDLPGGAAAAGAVGVLQVIGQGEIRIAATGAMHPVLVALSATAGRMKLIDATQAIAAYQGGAGSTLAGVALAVNDIFILSGSYEV